MPCPSDKVNRKFRAPAPNMLWVSDFTYVSTWQGFAYVALVIDTFANRIVGWKLSRSAKTVFVLDTLEQALYALKPVHKGGLIHHSDRGGQGRSQPVVATPLIISVFISVSKPSAGVLQPSVLRGLVFRA